MRYLIKQKIFSIGDKFSIKDESETDVFLVKRQLLSIGKKLRIYDIQENEFCYIEQKLFKFLPEYTIFVQGNLLATVKRKFTLLKKDFNIISPDSHYVVNGNVWGHEFSILKDDLEVAQISKAYFSFADTYSLDIDDDVDQITILSLAIVIDMVLHDGKNK